MHDRALPSTIRQAQSNQTWLVVLRVDPTVKTFKNGCMAKKLSKRISDETVFATIIQLCAAAGVDGQVRPEDVAMTIYEPEWQSLLKRIRLAARQLAEAGHIDILRKGEPADPDDFKGVYRLRITPHFFTHEAQASL